MRAFFFVCFITAFFAILPVDAASLSRNEISYALKEEATPEVEITVVDNRLKVQNAVVGSKLEIYSVVGVKVMEVEIKYPSGEYLLNIAKGYYIVRLGETVRKIVVR
jgi:hypothetical protein